MTKELTIGLVVPFSTDKVPDEGPMMYPGVKFIPRGVGVRALTPEGYDAAWDGILPAAKELAKQGVDAIMVIGTSLTFYRGYEAHQELLEQLRKGNRPAGLDHDRGRGRWAAQRRRQAHRGRHRLCRRGQQPARGFPQALGLRGAGAGGLRPVRVRRARQQERERHHRAQQQGHRGGRRRRRGADLLRRPAHARLRRADRKSGTAFRWSPARNRRSGRPCGLPATAATWRAAAGCWRNRRPCLA